MNQKWTKNRSKIHPGSSGRPLGASWGILGCLGGVLGRLGGVLARKRWPTWLQLGSQNGAKNEKKSKQKTIKILMPLGVDFSKILMDLGRQNGAKLAPKSHQKSIPTSKGDFLKKLCFSLGKQWFFEISMFRKKVAKSMQNGTPKVIKIHEKSVLGRPRVDIFGFMGRFFEGSKNH